VCVSFVIFVPSVLIDAPCGVYMVAQIRKKSKLCIHKKYTQ